MSQAQFDLPDTQVPRDVLERVQFSVSSRNAGSKVSECLTHVFVSAYSDNPSAVNWQYVSSGVTCLLRKKELSKNGRKLVWTVNMCLYNVAYGVLVWKGTIAANSCYTAVTDNFHVYVMHELNAIVGLLFEESSQARELLRSYLQWDAEKVKEERSKGGSSVTSSPSQFRKAMISKPCNFQHIQGTQALDECMEIEKIKTDIQAAFFGLASARGRNSTDGTRHSGGKRKKDAGKPRIQLQNVPVPHRASSGSRAGGHMAVESSKSVDMGSLPPARSRLLSQDSVPVELGMGVRNSMPPPLTIHQSQPDLLNDRQFKQSIPPPSMSPPFDPIPPPSMSPPFDPVPPPSLSPPFDPTVHSGSSGMGSPVTPTNTYAQTTPTRVESPKYDQLPLNGTKTNVQSEALVRNGVEPLYDGLQPAPPATTKPGSPVYDTLQKTPPQTRSNGNTTSYNPHLYVDAIIDDEVAGYTSVAGENSNSGNSLSLDYSPPPPRLSPLNFEKEFSQAAFFHPAFITSTTNC